MAMKEDRAKVRELGERLKALKAEMVKVRDERKALVEKVKAAQAAKPAKPAKE